MAFYHRNVERKCLPPDFRRQEEEVVDSLCRLGSRPVSPRSLLEQEKRIRREIANSNERRRMQSINAGFQSLRSLLPRSREGENLSKAAILQNTADYIYTLEQENARLLEQNSQMKRRVLDAQNNHDSDGSCSDSPLPKRKKLDASDLTDEGISVSSPKSESGVDDVKRTLLELRLSLDRERGLRLHLEEQVRQLKSQLLAEGLYVEAAVHVDRVSDDVEKPAAVVKIDDAGVNISPSSSPEYEAPQEILFEQLEPELLINVPINLGKSATVLLPCIKNLPVSESTGVQLPNTPDATSSIGLDSLLQQTYKSNTSRQSLETIVEAIRHVEGDHVFRDDPLPSYSHLVSCSDEEETISGEESISSSSSSDQKEHAQKTIHLLENGEILFRHQAIRSAPISQSRPGVIVANHS